MGDSSSNWLDIDTDVLAVGQKAYMTGKLKARGQLMLAMKLDSVFKQVIDTQVNKAKL
jgi:putative sterol carrier protein